MVSSRCFFCITISDDPSVGFMLIFTKVLIKMERKTNSDRCRKTFG